MKKRPFKYTVILALAGAVSAGGLQSCARGMWSGSGYPAYPGLEIELSSTSGVTGLTTSYLLTGEGYVYRWQGLNRPEDGGDLLGRAQSALLDSIAALASAPGLLTEGVEATGSMVRTLRIRRRYEEQRWSWVAGLSGKGTPEAIAPIADLLREIIRRTEATREMP